MAFIKRFGFCIVIIPILMLIAGTTCGAGDAVSDIPGTIAFIREGNIWIAKANGDSQKQLTNTGDCHSPAWSPDGTRIAYMRPGNVESNLWLFSTQNSSSQQLTKSGDCTSFCWSPSGSEIAYLRSFQFSSNTTEGYYRTYYYLWIINLSQMSAKRALSSLLEFTPPKWSDDGKWIAVTGFVKDPTPNYDPDVDMYMACSKVLICSPTGRVEKDLRERLCYPDSFAWSPDSANLFVLESGGDEGVFGSVIRLCCSSNGLADKVYDLSEYSFNSDPGMYYIADIQYIDERSAGLSLQGGNCAACTLNLVKGVFEWKRMPASLTGWSPDRATFLGSPEVFWLQVWRPDGMTSTDQRTLILISNGEVITTIQGSELSWFPGQ